MAPTRDDCAHRCFENDRGAVRFLGPRALLPTEIPSEPGLIFWRGIRVPVTDASAVSSASRRPPRGRFPFQRGGVRRPELVSEFTPGSVPPERAVRGTRPSRSFRAVISAPRVCGGRSPRFCVKGGEQQRSLGVQGGSVRASSNKEEEEHLVPVHYNREEANTHKAKEKKKQKAKQLFAESST